MTEIGEGSVDIVTPAKEMNNEEKQTGWKENERNQSNIEQSELPDYPKKMDELRKQMKDKQSRLAELSRQQRLLQDLLSDDYLRLQQEKKEIKIDLIQLNYIHLVNNVRYRRDLKQKQEEEQQRIRAQIKQRQQKRQQALQQQLEKIEQQKIQRRQRLERQFQQMRQKIEKDDQERKEKLKNLKEENIQLKKEQQEMIKKKTELRIQQIEAQLTAARLRRSRMATLEAELISLRSLRYSYWWDYPYWGRYYSPYLWPSAYYPYSWLI